MHTKNKHALSATFQTTLNDRPGFSFFPQYICWFCGNFWILTQLLLKAFPGGRLRSIPKSEFSCAAPPSKLVKVQLFCIAYKSMKLHREFLQVAGLSRFVLVLPTAVWTRYSLLACWLFLLCINKALCPTGRAVITVACFWKWSALLMMQSDWRSAKNK